MKTLLVVDGNSIINRAFYGVKPLTNKNGQQTGAVFGMLNIILSHMERLMPDYAAVAFDMRHPTFRHAMYDGYKGNRKGMPEELASQLPYARRALAGLGFTLLEKETYEADDILGTLARMSEESGDCRCYLLTGDKDSLQLISDTTSVLLAGNSETVLYDKAKFFEKYGIDSDIFVDLKALMGDTSDCIPGVPGVGEKTALKLLMEYGSLDEIFAHKEDSSLKPALKNKLAEGEKLAYLSKDLAKICREVPLDIPLTELRCRGNDPAILLPLFTELEFSSFIKRLSLDQVRESEKTEKQSEFPCETLSEGALLALPTDREYAAVMSENSLELFDGKSLYSCSFSQLSDIVGFFDKNRKIVLFDSKLLWRALLAQGLTDLPLAEDCSLAAYVLNASEGDYTFSRLNLAYLGKSEETENAQSVWHLWQALLAKLESENVLTLYKEVELPLSYTLARMEHTGFRVDREGLEAYSKQLAKMSEEYAASIYQLADGEFNINSPKQLGEVLFEKLGLPALKKTKSGYSTNAEVLEKLRPYHPIIPLIFEYRKVTKLRSTYTEGLLRVADTDGVVHTCFRQTGTATGRLSSSEPNLQNIPIRTEMGHELRRYFLPSAPGRVLVDADYSQIELRILAHMAKEETMLEAFRLGVDIHTVTASQVFGCMPELVTTEMRKRAKAVNFGIIYGISDFSLAGDIGVSKQQAGQYIKSYFATYPGIRAFMDGTVAQAKECGYTETMLGRRRYIPELASGKAMLRAFGERVAMNSPIQGSAADIIKLAMLRTEKALQEAKLDAKLILQVHDELVVDASAKDAEQVAEILKREMESALQLSVPLTVELSIGSNWYENK
ncbi:MAG: DNA polymerase I [Ruminococcaceae bacterium]|nr:DNA polymerase I [Oscillospiraceae bacterium]